MYVMIEFLKKNMVYDSCTAECSGILPWALIEKSINGLEVL